MNAALQTAIATHLNISPNQIKSVEEWASVLFVRFTVGRPRFVSKKVQTAMITLEEAQQVYGDPEAIERNYINQEVLEASYKMADALRSAGLAHHVRDGMCSFPVTWDVLEPLEAGLKKRQVSAAHVITAHIIESGV